jgi:hypothetical protein
MVNQWSVWAVAGGQWSGAGAEVVSLCRGTPETP